MNPDDYRLVLVCIAVSAFALLGIHDLVQGHVATGIAGLCLATANGLLLA